MIERGKSKDEKGYDIVRFQADHLIGDTSRWAPFYDGCIIGLVFIVDINTNYLRKVLKSLAGFVSSVKKIEGNQPILVLCNVKKVQYS